MKKYGKSFCLLNILLFLLLFSLQSATTVKASTLTTEALTPKTDSISTELKKNDLFSFDQEQVFISVGDTYSQEIKTSILEPLEFIFTSSNSNVATIDKTGTVTGISEGTTNITAQLKHSEYKAEYRLTVQNYYSITFINEDKIVSTVDVAIGDDLQNDSIPPVPEKTGYTGYWFYENQKLEDIIHNIKSNITIHINWQPKEYSVNFETNGGTLLSLREKSKKVIYDSSYGKFPEVTRKGYEFVGWFTKKSGGEEVSQDNIVGITKDTNLYAQWLPVMPQTLLTMENTNYYSSSITGLTNKKLPTSKIKSLIKPYGFYYGKGMPLSLYKKAITNQWLDKTDYNNKPKKITIDITKTLYYDNYVYYLKNLSRYEGVYLYDIGKSTDGRTLYAVEIDMPSEHDKKTICLTGQTHTREFAGGVFILKQLYELVQKAQTDEKTLEMLQHYKFAAVPIISLDAREGMIKNPKMWTASNGELWKAYSNGTDGNRNYPGLQMGQIYKNYTKKTTIASKPGYANYAGNFAGSCSETQAMMKWFYHYVIKEQAIFHIDYHQQGSIIYAGKPWQTAKQLQRCKNLAYGMASVLNKGNKRTYSYVPEDSRYGLRGEGSTATDFTVSLAVGAKFSPAYGFYVFQTNKKEYPLIQVRSLQTTKLVIKEANPDFATATLEIGSNTKYLGNSLKTRKLLAKEYQDYHFSQLLESLPKLWEKSVR